VDKLAIAVPGSFKIPQELDNKAVLNVSSQRGFFDSKYQSHVDEFQRFFENQTEQEGEDRVSSYLDLSQTVQGKLLIY